MKRRGIEEPAAVIEPDVRIEPRDQVRTSAGGAWGLAVAVLKVADGVILANGPHGQTRAPLPVEWDRIADFGVWPLFVLDRDGRLHEWKQGKNAWSPARDAFPKPKVRP